MIQQITLTAAIMGIMFFTSMISVNAIYEDQAVICLSDLKTEDNTEDFDCSIYNMDEILNRDNRSMIEYQIHNELDVFGPEYLLVDGPD